LDEIVASMRRQRAVQFLLPLFFVSGATALVYQTLWARQLHLVFGTSTFAISTVLASFMAGLAIGGFWMARRVDSLPRPLVAYGLLEIFIGLYALAFPMLLWVIEPTYLWVGRTFAPSPLVYGLIQFAMVGTALVLPTAGMGATLPLLARFATQRLGAAGNQVGLLYSVNTAGAVCGTVLAGFFLLPWFGLSATTWLAGIANLILGMCALGLANMSAGALQSTVEEDVEEPPLPADFPLVASVAFLAGFAALIYEVAWTRVLALRSLGLRFLGHAHRLFGGHCDWWCGWRTARGPDASYGRASAIADAVGDAPGGRRRAGLVAAVGLLRATVLVCGGVRRSQCFRESRRFCGAGLGHGGRVDDAASIVDGSDLSRRGSCGGGGPEEAGRPWARC
jgi:hypothetical protein